MTSSTRLGPDELRAVLGHFPSGITVITATTTSGPAGFTCQSFSSLSLDPALIVVLPGRSSTSWPAIAVTGRFCVNVLAGDQETLSRAFARTGTDKFAGTRWRRSALGSPILDGVAAWIDCRLHAVHPGGDHLIVVGAIHDLAAAAERVPLVFHRGAHTRLEAPTASSATPAPERPATSLLA